jgi:N-acyl-D-amino-acid deacylase
MAFKYFILTVNLIVRWLAAALCLFAGLPAFAQNYDVIIRHGRIIDGTGAPAFDGDLAIKDGHIAAVGKVDGTATKELDAGGLVIAPGFIDVHTHAENIESQPKAEAFLRMGVTTLVLGNCGTSTLHVGKFFQDMEAKKFTPNIATLIGHGTVRRRAMGGSYDRPPTPEELTAMRGMVEQAMKDGAVGMSTGLIYQPGTFAKTDEIIELAKVASAYGGIYTSHMRNEGDRIMDSINEVIRIAREANIRAEISHIKLSGPANWHRADKVLKLIARARAHGLQITQDQYAYLASSTGIDQLIPDKALEGGKFSERIADPKQKADIIRQMKASLRRRKSPDYSYAVIASYSAGEFLNGLNVAQAAKKLRGSDSLDDQIETIFEIEKHGGASGVFHGMSEDDLQKFMQNTNTMIAADSEVRRFGKGVPHPRGYGNNARVLARYVRELKVLTLPDAIRKMTSLPARTFQFPERGELRPGYWADVVVLDSDTVQDHATYEDPHHYSTGFRYVLVNGVVAVENDQENDARPGMVLRHQAPSNTKAQGTF